MRGLIIFCFVSVALAVPQYQYSQSEVSPSAASGLQGLPQFIPIVYNKQYYIHSAPDDSLDADGLGSDSALVGNKRNLRVVFIKAPENKGLENAALQLARGVGEDRTAIYVLSRQTDLGELQSKLSQITDSTAKKPEVHFVKYRTREEAEHAQHTIRAQYDALGGPTSVSNEGIAPVRSFIGSLGQSQGSGPSAGLVAGYEPRENNGYLPPARL